MPACWFRYRAIYERFVLSCEDGFFAAAISALLFDDFVDRECVAVEEYALGLAWEHEGAGVDDGALTRCTTTSPDRSTVRVSDDQHLCLRCVAIKELGSEFGFAFPVPEDLWHFDGSCEDAFCGGLAEV